jgi:Tfp pilus assembly protein PilZ
VAHNTLFKAGRVVWCGAVGYESELRADRRLQHVAHNTLFKAGRVVWCGAVGYASGLRAVARATGPQPV